MIQQLNNQNSQTDAGKPLQKLSLQVRSDLDALPQVLGWFDRLDHTAMAYETWLQCQLVLTEGFTNAVRHAHRQQSADVLIDLEVCRFPDWLEIRIWDRGLFFDLDQTLQTLLETDQSDLLSERGRGLKLMYRITDFLVYTRMADDRNLLLMIKRYPECT